MKKILGFLSCISFSCAMELSKSTNDTEVRENNSTVKTVEMLSKKEKSEKVMQWMTRNLQKAYEDKQSVAYKKLSELCPEVLQFAESKYAMPSFLRKVFLADFRKNFNFDNVNSEENFKALADNINHYKEFTVLHK